MTPTPRLSVLVVEDGEDAAWAIAELLTLAGHAVQVARTGPDAVRVSGDDPPDVILLDIGLPGVDGWEVARRVRDRAGGRQPFVVAVTGYGADRDRGRSADAGVDLHLVKPAAPAALLDLLAWVRSVLNTPAPPLPEWEIRSHPQHAEWCGASV